MTLEKLSLRILIKDVIKRMLVMQTKISWVLVNKIPGELALRHTIRGGPRTGEICDNQLGVICSQNWGCTLFIIS